MSLFFFFNDTATTEIYTLSLHDALPISAEAETPALERTAANHRHRWAAPQPRPGAPSVRPGRKPGMPTRHSRGAGKQETAERACRRRGADQPPAIPGRSPLRRRRASAERTDQAVSRNPAAQRMRRYQPAEGIRSRRPHRVTELHPAGIDWSPRAREVRRRPCYRGLVKGRYWY